MKVHSGIVLLATRIEVTQMTISGYVRHTEMWSIHKWKLSDVKELKCFVAALDYWRNLENIK